jgi:hypothetical protein
MTRSLPSTPRRRLLAAFAGTVALASPAAFAATKKKGVEMAEARALVLDLPEVKAWQQSRREAAQADAKVGGMATGGILTGRRKVAGKDYWALTFYEDPQVTAKKWNVFFVRISDAALFVDAGEGKSPQPIAQWRKAAATR